MTRKKNNSKQKAAAKAVKKPAAPQAQEAVPTTSKSGCFCPHQPQKDTNRSYHRSQRDRRDGSPFPAAMLHQQPQ